MTADQPHPGATEPSPAKPRRCRRYGAAALVVLLSLTFVGVMAGHAWSDRFAGHCGFMSGAADPARAERRAAVFADHIADRAGATTEQREKLVTIVKGAAREIAPLRQKIQDTRKQVIDAFSQPAIDRARIDQLRSEQMANMDAVSKRMTQAIADAGDVLTPDQRKKLAEAMPLGDHGGWWGHGGHHGGGFGDHWGHHE